MSGPVNQILEALSDPRTRHAALVHLPIALAMIGLLLSVVSAIAVKSHVLRWTTVAGFLLLALSARFAVGSGEEAHDLWSVQFAPEVYEILDSHEEKAELVWMFGLSIAALVALGAVRKPRFRAVAAWLAVVASLFTAGWLGYVGHLGGQMVYGYGVGTPQPVTARGLAAAGEPGAASADPRVVFFREQVFPILEEHCMRCHNPARLRRVGGLDQTTIAGLLKGGVSGPALVPGRPDESLMLQAARHEIEDLEMPADGDRLPDELIDRLAQWIRDGAVWEAIEPRPTAETEESPAEADDP